MLVLKWVNKCYFINLVKNNYLLELYFKTLVLNANFKFALEIQVFSFNSLKYSALTTVFTLATKVK